MDYASRLNQAAGPDLSALAGADYSKLWQNAPGVYGQGPLANFRLSADGAQVTPEQKSILDAMLGIFNSAGVKS